MGAIVMPRQSVEARPGLVWAQYRSSEGGVNNGWVYVVVVNGWTRDRNRKHQASALDVARAVIIVSVVSRPQGPSSMVTL